MVERIRRRRRSLERYGGDLRRLREEAERDVEREHKLLQQFKGIGTVGADIFLREAQGLWSEAYPYADRRVTTGPKKIGLPGDAKKLAALVPRKGFPRFVAAMVRIDLKKAVDDVREQAKIS